MPRHDPPRITTIDARTGETIDDQPAPTIEDDIAKQLDDIIAEFGQSETDVTWQIVVTRATGPSLKGVKEPYLFSCDTSEISGIRDRLRDEYGEGTYRIRVRKNGRNHRQFDYAIETPIKVKTEGGNDISRALLDRMDRMEQRNNEVMQQLVTARSGQLPMQFDPLSMVEKIMTMVGAMQTAMFSRAAPAAPDAFDLMGRTFEMAKTIAELRGGGDNGGPAETNIYDILKEAVKNPNLVNALNPAGNQPQRLPAPNQGRVQPGPINRPNQPPHETVREMSPAEMRAQVTPRMEPAQPMQSRVIELNAADLQTVIPYLNGLAARGASVEFYCDWMFDNLEPNIIDAMLTDANLLNSLAQQFPTMGPYLPWYNRLLAEMRLAAQDATDADAANGPQNGQSEATAASREPARHAPTPQFRHANVMDSLAGQAGNMGDTQDHGGQSERG